MIFLGQPGSPQVLTACVVAQLGGCGRYTPILPPPFPHRPFSQMNSPVKKLVSLMAVRSFLPGWERRN
jgi:hypothetical protein